jgi:prevent-host-death family protein
MLSVGITELKRDASTIVKRVREEKETIEVTYRGSVVAQIVPVESEEERQARFDRVWKRMDALAEKVSENWTGEGSAVDAVRESRRDF